MFFSNVHIRKSEAYSPDALKELLIGQMVANGYRVIEDSGDADVSTAIYSPQNSSWVSVASDCFQFNTAEDTKNLISPISDKFKTDVMAVSCNDSDYLMINLINTQKGLDGWVNVGTLYGENYPRRTRLSPWKPIVKDFEKFKAIFKGEYTFAEEPFYDSAELINMDPGQCALEPDSTDDIDESLVVHLNFAMPEGVEKELPKITMDRYSLMPCRIGQSNCVFVNNRGGKSKGVGIMFVGDYIENDELTFEDVTFESDYGSEKRKIVPIELKKVKLETGKTALYWENKNFNIPKSVNQSIPQIKRMDLEFQKQFGVRFTVQGNPRKVLDVRVFIIPLENWKDGGVSWYVYKASKTKEQFIIDHNSSGYHVDGYYNPDDYDL